MVVSAVIAGAVAAGILLFLAALVGLHRERAFYAALIIAIAFFYPVFSAERLDFQGAVIQCGIAFVFLWLALVAYKIPNTFAMAFVIVGHAIFDAAAYGLGIHAPMFWAELCMGFDVVLAVGARVFIR